MESRCTKAAARPETGNSDIDKLMEGIQPIRTSPDVRKWSLECLGDSKPPSRRDVRKLREWLTARVQRLQNEYASRNDSGDIMMLYSEQLVDVYNAAFHELTRQVSHACTDQAKFMADLWTSTHEILGTVLLHTKAQQQGYKAVASALQSKDTVVTSSCELMQKELLKQRAQNVELSKEIKTLQKRLEQAEQAAWDNVTKVPVP